MPTVPVVDQTAMQPAQYSAGGVAPFRNAAPGQQVALGQATQQAGELAMRTGATIGDALAAQVDDATVKNAETAYLQQANTILYDPQNGYLNQRGQSAIDNFAPAKQAVAKASQDALDGMKNPIQKHMLSQALNQHLLSFGRVMADHNFQQTTQYSGEAAANRAETYGTSASNAFSSYGQTDADGNATGDFAKNLQTAEQETLNSVRIMKGAPAGSDVANAALLKLHTEVAAGALIQMMDARAPYSKIQSVYDDMKGKGFLDERATDTLGKMVKTYSEQESTRAAVNQNLSDAYRASQGQPTKSTGTPDYQYPQKGATVTSHPYDPEAGAVTVNSPQGSSIQAPADGKVVQVGKNADDEFSMQIQHADGSTTSFAGLSAANVKVGDQVQGGQSIANSAGAVQWSLADKNGNAVDPTKAGLAPVDLTKITDEKILGNALDSLRKQVTDPYLQQQATSEMESIVRHNQQMQNAQVTQTYKSASDQFYNNGMRWRSIDPSVFNQLTGEQRQHFKDAQNEHIEQQWNLDQFFKRTGETDQLVYYYNNPKELVQANLDQSRANGKLSNESYLSLSQKATELQRNPLGVVEAGAINDRIAHFAIPAGIDPKSRLPEQQKLYSDLHYAVDNAIGQIKANNHGKATQQQVDDAINQLVTQQTIKTVPQSWSWSGVDMKKIYNFERPNGASYTATAKEDGSTHYYDANGKDLGVVR